MIEIEVTCRECGEDWTLDHHDFITGRWRYCLSCRGHPDTTPCLQTGGEDHSEAHSDSQEHMQESDE